MVLFCIQVMLAAALVVCVCTVAVEYSAQQEAVCDEQHSEPAR